MLSRCRAPGLRQTVEAYRTALETRPRRACGALSRRRRGERARAPERRVHRHAAGQGLGRPRAARGQGARAGRGGRLRPRRAASRLRCRPADSRGEAAQATRAQIQAFVTFLWDIGLEVGQSVRSVKDCVRESKKDITVATNLMEARLIVGDAKLFERMRRGHQRQQALAQPEILRSEMGGTARPPPQVSRHGLQPGAQRQGRAGGTARHPDDRLGGETPLRGRHAARARHPRISHRGRIHVALRGSGVFSGRCVSRCT